MIVCSIEGPKGSVCKKLATLLWIAASADANASMTAAAIGFSALLGMPFLARKSVSSLPLAAKEKILHLPSV